MFHLASMTPGPIFPHLFDELQAQNLSWQDIMDYLTRREWNDDPRGTDDRSLAILIPNEFPQPKPQPKTASQPKPQPAPKPETKPAQPETKPEPQPEPAPESQPTIEPPSAPAPESQPKSPSPQSLHSCKSKHGSCKHPKRPPQTT